MGVAKIAISIDRELLEKLDQLIEEKNLKNRSSVIQSAIEDKVVQLSHYRLARECEKLDPKEEQAIAEERLKGDIEWPEF